MKAWHFLLIAAAVVGVFLVMRKKAGAADMPPPPSVDPNPDPNRPGEFGLTAWLNPSSIIRGLTTSPAMSAAPPLVTLSPPSHNSMPPPQPPEAPAAANSPPRVDPATAFAIDSGLLRGAGTVVSTLGTMPGFEWVQDFKLNPS